MKQKKHREQSKVTELQLQEHKMKLCVRVFKRKELKMGLKKVWEEQLQCWKRNWSQKKRRKKNWSWKKKKSHLKNTCD